MVDGVPYCLNVNSSRYARVRSRSPATFKTKLYVSTVNNSFHSSTIFVELERTWKLHFALKFFAFNIKWTKWR